MPLREKRRCRTGDTSPLVDDRVNAVTLEKRPANTHALAHMSAWSPLKQME
jgi:hypothetical protein